MAAGEVEIAGGGVELPQQHQRIAAVERQPGAGADAEAAAEDEVGAEFAVGVQAIESGARDAGVDQGLLLRRRQLVDEQEAAAGPGCQAQWAGHRGRPLHHKAGGVEARATRAGQMEQGAAGGLDAAAAGAGLEPDLAAAVLAERTGAGDQQIGGGLHAQVPAAGGQGRGHGDGAIAAQLGAAAAAEAGAAAGAGAVAHRRDGQGPGVGEGHATAADAAGQGRHGGAQRGLAAADAAKPIQHQGCGCDHRLAAGLGVEAVTAEPDRAGVGIAQRLQHHGRGAPGSEGQYRVSARRGPGAEDRGLVAAATADDQRRHGRAVTRGAEPQLGRLQVDAGLADGAGVAPGVPQGTAGADVDAGGAHQRAEGEVALAAEVGRATAIGAEVQAGHVAGAHLQPGLGRADAAAGAAQLDRTAVVAKPRAVFALSEGGGGEVQQARGVHAADTEAARRGEPHPRARAGVDAAAGGDADRGLQAQGHAREQAGVGDQRARRQDRGVAGGGDLGVFGADGQGFPAGAVAVVLLQQLVAGGGTLELVVAIGGSSADKHHDIGVQLGAGVHHEGRIADGDRHRGGRGVVRGGARADRLPEKLSAAVGGVEIGAGEVEIL